MDDQTILVRAVEPEDLPGVTEVFNQPGVIRGTLQVPYVSLESRLKRHQATPAGHVLLVAVLGGRIIGTGGLHPSDNRRRAHAASLGMAVHDAYAGRGAGRAILTALLDQADLWLNIKRIELTVWTDNERAIALYERAGFEREGLLRAYAWRDGAYADALSMARLRL